VPVPLLDLKAQYAPLRDEILDAVTRVCDSQRFIHGPEVEGLERELEAFLGIQHAIGMSSGTDAVLAALMALDIGPGDEVVTSTYSFFATAGCVARLGARPVLVDIEPDTYNIDPAAAVAAISPRTRAIVPVHLFGQSAELMPIINAAARAGVAIIEDAAQAIGARYHDHAVGSFGAIGCFSFFPSKNLGAFGDAGLVTTSDEALAARIRRLRNHGAEMRYFHREIGGNFRLDALQAAVLRVKLPHLTRWNQQRRANANTYHQLFAASGLEQVALPGDADGRTHIYHQYVVRVRDRDRVRAHLTEAGIGTDVYYPVPFHRQECFAAIAPRDRAYPHADRASKEVLALPIFPELTRAQQEHVVAGLADCWKQAEA